MKKMKEQQQRMLTEKLQELLGMDEHLNNVIARETNEMACLVEVVLSKALSAIETNTINIKPTYVHTKNKTYLIEIVRTNTFHRDILYLQDKSGNTVYIKQVIASEDIINLYQAVINAYNEFEPKQKVYPLIYLDPRNNSKKILAIFKEESDAVKNFNTLKVDLLAKYRLTCDGGDWDCIVDDNNEFILVDTKSQVTLELKLEMQELW